MPDRTETARLLEAFHNTKPQKLFEHFNTSNTGISCVLTYLYRVREPVTAGQISSHMNVSTARVAVLIRNMESKGLIVKTSDPDDARKTMIAISDEGVAFIQQRFDYMLELMSAVIDRVGVERFELFTEISNEIGKAIDDELASIDSNADPQ